MIISASRRTDIPAYYTPWLLRRLEDKEVLVRNPMNPRQISRVSLRPEDVDGLVLWTKNPGPLLPHVDKLREYPFYVQFTLTSYGTDVEPRVPSKRKVLIDVFKRLAEAIGPERIVWRYDPILISPVYTEAYHVEYFGRLAGMLRGYTRSCTISFLDEYPRIRPAMERLGRRELSEEGKRRLAAAFVRMARACDLRLETCAETIDLSDMGIGHAACIDADRLSHIAGRAITAPRDKNQRPACGCAASVDIGAYDTCGHGCRYCYACRGPRSVEKNEARYDPSSPLLCGRVEAADTIRDRLG